MTQLDKKIYRVLSADDEYWSRENIRNLIDWGTYSIEFLEPACDGEEVLKRIPEEKPDILFTDINMPFIGGLELLDKIHEKYPELITVAISGYDDFAKVKGVFTSGGIDYLLKPIGKEELVEVLTKALAILEKREKLRQNEETSILQEHKLSSFLEDNEYSGVLNGKLYNPNRQVHITSTSALSEVSMILVKFHDIEKMTRKYGHDMLQMSYSYKSELKKMMEDENCVVFNYSDKVNEFVIFSTTSHFQIHRFTDNLINSIDIGSAGPVSVIVHEQPSSLDDIGIVYREMISCLMTRPFTRTHCVIYCESDTANNAIKERIGRRTQESIESALRQCQRSKLIYNIFDSCSFEECDTWTYFEMSQFITRIMNVFEENCRDNSELSQIIAEGKDAAEFGLRRIDKDTIRESISLMIDSSCQSGENDESDGSIGSQVRNVYDYIDRNYVNPITLTMLADEFHVDASYLSKVFSQTYGKTITMFITAKRIGKAEELISETDNKLEAISYQVGYDDYNYFSRVFRKQTGVSPSEFKKREGEKR